MQTRGRQRAWAAPFLLAKENLTAGTMQSTGMPHSPDPHHEKSKQHYSAFGALARIVMIENIDTAYCFPQNYLAKLR